MSPAPLASTPPARRRRPLWLRLLLLALICGGSVILMISGLAIAVGILWQKPTFQTFVFQQMIERQRAQPEPPPAQPAAPFEDPHWNAAPLTAPGELFQPDRIWTVHLHFTADQWTGLGPIRVPSLSDWRRPDGTLQLRNPAAAQPGIAGVLGFDLPWSRGDFQFGGVDFTNVAVRFKGNGTFLGELRSCRRPFKIDLGRHDPKRQLAGLRTLNLHNLTSDHSFLRDTLAYEFYRDAGVPAPRTTFARVFLAIDGTFTERLLGLYVVVENPDTDWTRRTFGTNGVALFKPSTPELFADLGDAWVPYHETYDPKTKTRPPQRSRLVELARLVTHADDAEFARRIGELVDLDNAARFLACETLQCNYDGILCNGQNFLLWLDPRTNRFGFGPWDLDQAWGQFDWIGTAREREQADLFHPWVGPNRFLERLFAVDAFQSRYRAELRRILDTVFVPERLIRRLDALAAVVRPAIAEQSSERLAQFEREVAEPPPETPGPEGSQKKGRREYRSAHQIKRFIAARAEHARAQLEGRAEGARPQRK